jgi:hypothetical protein
LPPKAIILALFLTASAVLALPGQEARPLPGDLAMESFPETAPHRVAFFDSLIKAPRSSVLAFKARETVKNGLAVKISVVKQADAFYILFEPKRAAGYFAWGQGTWIVKRGLADGAFIQAKVFLKSDPGLFLRIFPHADRTRLEILAYGGVLYSDVLLPVPFDEALRLPMERIRSMTAATVDWSLFSPRPALYAPLRDMAASIRSYLPKLNYTDDGAVDEAGRAVFIRDGSPQPSDIGLNCSGFAKWVVDGIYAASDPGLEGILAGGERPALTRIADLKIKRLDERGTTLTEPYEDLRDPFFGLDWVRNLDQALSERLYPAQKIARSELDVRDPPFSFISGPGSVLNHSLPYDVYPDFRPDTGYQVAGLKSLLYLLAMRDPGAFYLASQNKPEGAPEIRQHTHIAVFLPFVEANGIFSVAVFESAAETSIEKVMARGRETFVYLVRMPYEGLFRPDLAMWAK